jgi:hypothetical protein
MLEVPERGAVVRSGSGGTPIYRNCSRHTLRNFDCWTTHGVHVAKIGDRALRSWRLAIAASMHAIASRLNGGAADTAPRVSSSVYRLSDDLVPAREIIAGRAGIQRIADESANSGAEFKQDVKREG